MDRQVELLDQLEKVCGANIQDIKYIDSVIQVSRNILNTDSFSCTAKHIVHPNNLQDLHWTLNSEHFLSVKPTDLDEKSTNAKNETLQASDVKKVHY